MKAKSGAFVSVNVALAETGVYLGDFEDCKDSTASAVSTDGDIRMDADGLVRSVTYSISSPISVDINNPSNPAPQQPATTYVSTKSTFTVVETVLGQRSTATSGLKAKMVSKLTGSNVLGSMLNNGAGGETSSDIPGAQIAGAMGIAVLDNQIQALVNTQGSFAAEKGSIALRKSGREPLRRPGRRLPL